MNHNQKMELIQNATCIVGIDIGKDIHVATILNNKGLELKKGIKIANSVESINLFEQELKEHNPQQVLIGMEPTGNYYKPLAYYMATKRYTILTVNPYHTKLSKEIGTNNRSKNDVKDSALIAKLVVQGSFTKGILLVKKYAELRKLTTLRLTQVQEQTRATIRLKTLLNEYCPEFEKTFSKIVGNTSLEFLQEYGFEGLRSNEGLEQKINFIVKRSRGRIKFERAQFIVERLTKTIGHNEGIEAAQIELNFLIEQIVLFKKNISSLEGPIEDLLMTLPETSFVIGIKGIGVITLATILGQIGSFEQFTNAHQIEKLAGLNLVQNESGKFIGKITLNKRGRDVLRHMLYMIALNLITNNADFKALYKHKVEVQKKPKTMALIAIAQKFIRVMFSMVKNKSAYKSEFIIVR